ncbi:MAG: hypothetical protein DRJ05_05485 [Bacteroidetes bacterium]|nr:MAG: hypothetical protein DRJ05_05485 [Bacteroidota bacterium]
MTTIQSEQNLIDYTKDLPKEALQEILDFISFIRSKNRKEQISSLNSELSYLNKSQIDYLEEEFTDYKTLYPIE